MQKVQIAMDEKVQKESRIKKQRAISFERLKRKLYERDKELYELKIETRNLIGELDSAYKELRKTQDELIIREKLSAVGGLAAGVAHEMGNALNIIGMSVQHLHNKFKPGDERREFTETVMDKVEKLNSVATELIQFGRPHIPDFQKNDIHKILDRMLSLVKFKCIIQNVKMVKEYSPNLPLIMIDNELMEQVFLNIIDNALWAMPKGGKLGITTRVPSENSFVVIEMTDTGYGISRQDISRIFDPFFTRRENGTGLGLSIVHRIIEEHKGIISVQSNQKKGTAFLLKLRISQKK